MDVSIPTGERARPAGALPGADTVAGRAGGTRGAEGTAPAGRAPGLERLARSTLVWLLLPAVATVLGLIDASQVQYDRALRGEPITWGHALTHGLPRWYAWGLLVPLVLVVARWAERGLGAWPSKAAVHLGAGLAVTFVQVGLFSVSSSILHGGPDPLAHLRPAFQKYIGLTYLGGLVTYAILVGGWYGAELYRRYRTREREAARLDVEAAALQTRLAEARLRHLQSQLQPHFLFNALHALSGLVLEGERRDAVRMTTRLSELLRRSLRAAETPEIALDEELRLLEDYLAIQKLRFGDRLDERVRADPEARRAAVPPLVLQPLVENAVRHGVEGDPSAGVVEVRCRRDGDALVLIVEDDGPGPDVVAGRDRGRPDEGGVGLTNTRRRLHGLYGDDASLTLEPREGGGARAVVRLPWREAGAP